MKPNAKTLVKPKVNEDDEEKCQVLPLYGEKSGTQLKTWTRRCCSKGWLRQFGLFTVHTLTALFPFTLAAVLLKKCQVSPLHGEEIGTQLKTWPHRCCSKGLGLFFFFHRSHTNCTVHFHPGRCATDQQVWVS